MNVPTYQVAQNVHGPRFTTPAMLNFQMVQQYSFSKKLLSLPIITGYYLNFIIGYS